MTLVACFNTIDQARGADGPTAVKATRAVSPAAGIVSSGLTGDSRAAGYVTASVLGTGQNVDTLTNVCEAV